MSRATQARDVLAEALETATAELHELRTENMRLRHQARELCHALSDTAAELRTARADNEALFKLLGETHAKLAAELVTVQASVDRLLAQCVRQRALLDDLRCCPVERSTMSHVTLWIGRSTWDALHAIGSES